MSVGLLVPGGFTSEWLLKRITWPIQVKVSPQSVHPTHLEVRLQGGSHRNPDLSELGFYEHPVLLERLHRNTTIEIFESGNVHYQVFTSLEVPALDPLGRLAAHSH